VSAEAPTTESSAADLERMIGHSFGCPELLAEALTHPSASASPYRSGTKGHRRNRDASRAFSGRGYERLEFLGDRVLGLVIADVLWRRYATEPEGDLTRRLAHLVQRDRDEQRGHEHHRRDEKEAEAGQITTRSGSCWRPGAAA